MLLQDFHYDLPDELIAQSPLSERAASKLMVLDKRTGNIEHKIFTDLIDYINPGDLLVMNDTRVMPARLHTVKDTGGKVEILVERILDKHHALVHMKASKPCKPGCPLWIVDKNNDVSAVRLVVGDRQNDLIRVQFPESVLMLLDKYGHMPLPPYIKREDTDADLERYQTVYAQKIGAVAAPTAGLHFTDEIMTKIREKGAKIAYVTLHVGAGTFMPVRTENINEHRMHLEMAHVSQELCDLIKQTKQNGNRVIAIGTTSVRALESCAKHSKEHVLKMRRAFKGVNDLIPFESYTDLFIYPGYEYLIPDAIFTNFHLPGSTLLMLCSAFAGKEKVLNAYLTAVEEKYRFFSYGDAMLMI